MTRGTTRNISEPLVLLDIVRRDRLRRIIEFGIGSKFNERESVLGVDTNVRGIAI
jgi:hypothetical protein